MINLTIFEIVTLFYAEYEEHLANRRKKFHHDQKRKSIIPPDDLVTNNYQDKQTNQEASAVSSYP
jgi:hypothetical protein